MTRNLFETGDDRGVSPVIGVILMVAITVILAAVIGTFVLGLGENVSQSTPQAQLTLSANGANGNLTITHKGGDPITANTIKVKLTEESSGDSVTFNPTSGDKLTVGDTAIINTTGTNDELWWPAGTNVTVNPDGDVDLTTGNSYNLKIIHKDSQQLIADQSIIP